jgi:hypothetical protein
MDETIPRAPLSFDPSAIEAALPPLIAAIEQAVQALPALENLPDIRLMRLATRVRHLRVDLGNYQLRLQRESKRAGP